jgi:hypothetical protein
MANRLKTPEGRAAHSKAMKAYWRRKRAETRMDPSTNGCSVESQIILHLKGTDVQLTVEEARALRDGLTSFLPKATSR